MALSPCLSQHPPLLQHPPLATSHPLLEHPPPAPSHPLLQHTPPIPLPPYFNIHPLSLFHPTSTLIPCSPPTLRSHSSLVHLPSYFYTHPMLPLPPYFYIHPLSPFHPTSTPTPCPPPLTTAASTFHLAATPNPCPAPALLQDQLLVPFIHCCSTYPLPPPTLLRYPTQQHPISQSTQRSNHTPMTLQLTRHP